MSPAQCTDLDGDGFGFGCAKGADCDDTNAAQTGLELCDDGRDNDCDGRVDENAGSACGCASGCKSTPIGGSGKPPFVANPGNSGGGVTVAPDGTLQLSSTAEQRSYIWIANSGQGSISKIRTDREPYVEEARYFSGPRTGYTCVPSADSLPSSCGYLEGVDPSRTSVNGQGDIFIGNRNGGRITKIASERSRCTDRDGNGVQTSTGPSNVLPWGTDDCVRWDTQLLATSDAAVTLNGNPNRIRAVAAQDVEGTDGRLQRFVWVGDTDRSINGVGRGVIWKLDGETGAVLLTTRIAGCHPYGFALDGDDNLWVSCRDNRALGRLDTKLCTSTSQCSGESGAAQTCNGEGVQGGRNCDTAMKQWVTLGRSTYGITVDFRQRVWIAAYGDGGGLFRYDPRLAVGSRLVLFQTKPGDSIGNVVGVTADLRGFVYGGLDGGSILQLTADSAPGDNQWTKVAVGATQSWGMSTDFQGNVWVIGRYQNTARVAKPTATLGTLSNTGGSVGITGLGGPYTYSDMSGSQLRYATNPTGYFRHVFAGCSSGSTVWKNLWWDAATPAGTRITFFVRTANSQAELDALGDADFLRVAEVPGSTAPVDVGALLQAAGVAAGQLLEVEVRLESENSDPTRPQTPSLTSLDMAHSCKTAGGGGLG